MDFVLGWGSTDINGFCIGMGEDRHLMDFVLGWVRTDINGFCILQSKDPKV